MENTLDNQSKFMALYWGQKVCVYPPNSLAGKSGGIDVVGWMICQPEVKNLFLELKPLSSISDEDAQKCGIRNAVELLAMNDGIYMSYSLGSKLIALGYYIGEHIGENYPFEYGWVRLSE